MHELSEIQTELISKIAKDSGLEKFVICSEAGTEKGDNYMGIITTVTVIGDQNVLHLVLKTSPSSKNFRDSMRVAALFTREIYVYETVIPILDKIQKECQVKHFFYASTKFSGSYVGHNLEFLVTEDLRTNQFKLWNRKVPMNSEHITVVLREYAKLHSLGFVVNKKYAQQFDNLLVNMKDLFMGKDRMFPTMKNFLARLATKTARTVESDNRAVAAIDRHAPKLYDYYNNELTRPEHKLVVLHGDCWCNNMMFKYKDPSDETKPDQICFLDWQLSKVGSPGQDLVYFLFTSAGIEDLRNYKHYLKIYHEILSENLESAGLVPDEVYPFSMLEDHIKHFSLFGLMTAVMILQLMILDRDEAPDLSQMNDDFLAMINMEGTNQQQYRERILNLVLFLLDNELL